MKQCYRAGIDIGSTTAKLVILDERGVLCYGEYRRHCAHTQETLAELLEDAGIVRCRRKIAAAVVNARCFLEIQRQFGSFANYLYSFTDGQAQLIGGEARTTSPLSDAIARDLKRRGMRYMGSVTVYSYLQAVGVVNDHEPGCFLHRARKGG